MTFSEGAAEILAKYSGDSNYAEATTNSPIISIADAPVTADVDAVKANFNRKKQLLSVGLTVNIQSTAPATCCRWALSILKRPPTGKESGGLRERPASGSWRRGDGDAHCQTDSE